MPPVVAHDDSTHCQYAHRRTSIAMVLRYYHSKSSATSADINASVLRIGTATAAAKFKTDAALIPQLPVHNVMIATAHTATSLQAQSAHINQVVVGGELGHDEVFNAAPCDH
jgi:hypothetical protein